MPENLKPKVILFDFYGTLADVSTDEVMPAVWETLSKFLRYWKVTVEPQRLSKLYFDAIENSLNSSKESFPEIRNSSIMAEILSTLGWEQPGRLHNEMTRLFRTLTITRLAVFDDTLSTLTSLRKQFRLGLVSDAQREFIEVEIVELGLDSFWDTMVISSDLGYRKPDSRLFHKALRELGVTADEAIYVGDNPRVDIKGARAAGLFSVLIDRNQSKNLDEEIPCKRCNDLGELRVWLLRDLQRSAT